MRNDALVISAGKLQRFLALWITYMKLTGMAGILGWHRAAPRPQRLPWYQRYYLF